MAPDNPRPSERTLLLAVFLISFAMMLFEMAFFQVVLLLTNYLLAVYSIAIALMGLIAGGVLAFLTTEKLTARPGRLCWLPLGFAVAVGLSIADVLWLHTVDPLRFFASAFLVFLCAGWLLSHAFARHDSYRVYAADMLGAGLGVVGAVLLVPAILEENALGLSLALGLAIAALLGPRRPWLRAAGLAAAAAGFAALLVWNHDTAGLNLVRDARPNQLTNRASLTYNPDAERWILSRSSMSGRLDFSEPRVDFGAGAEGVTVPANPLGIRTTSVTTFINNRALDGVNVFPAEAVVPDIRLPGVLEPGGSPRILVVGAAAEGIVKAAVHLGGGRATSVEINPATVAVMTGELDAYSRHAYRGLDLHLTDVRTFLEVHDARFDVITLLNTHPYYLGYDPLPEYVFTVEAVRQMLRHLDEDGWIDIEEMVYEPGAQAAFQREVANFLRVLRDQGLAREPARHLYVYRWHRDQVPEGWWFYQILVRKVPFEPETVARLDAWVASLAHPELATEVVFAAGLREPSLAWVAGALALDDHAPITDDHPFNAASFLDDFRRAMNSMTGVLALLGLGILALPLARFFRAADRPRRAWSSVAFFVSSGFGYMGFEIYMLQKNQLYIGSAGMSLVVSIAVMLLMSGLGGLLAARLGARAQRALIGCIPLALAAVGLLTPVLLGWSGFWFQSQLARVALVLLLLGPVCFLMGVPFAAGLQSVRRQCGGAFAAVMYAVNGIAASLGAVLTLNLSLHHGFHAVLGVSIGLYAVVFVASLAVVSEPSPT